MLCLLAGALLPNFAAKETKAQFRTLTPFYAIVYSFIIFQLFHFYEARKKPHYISHILKIFVGVHLLSACYYLTAGMVLPNAKVHREISHYIRTNCPQKPNGIIYITPPHREIRTKYLRETNEFGKQHNLYGWAFMFYYKALLKEIYPDNHQKTLYVHSNHKLIKNWDGIFTIDGNDFIPHPVAEDPMPSPVIEKYWDDAIPLENYWHLSKSLGLFRRISEHYIYHYHYGYIQLEGFNKDNFWMKQENGSWGQASTETFPSYYVKESDSWHTLEVLNP